LSVGRSDQDLLLRVAPAGTSVAMVGASNVMLAEKNGFMVLQIPAAATPVAVKLLLSDGDSDDLQAYAKTTEPPVSLEPFTHAGPRRWPELLKTQAVVGGDSQAFAIDVLTHPANNPWNCQIRLTGFDFY